MTDRQFLPHPLLVAALLLLSAGCGISPDQAGYGKPPHKIVTFRTASPREDYGVRNHFPTPEGKGTTRHLSPWFSFETTRQLVALHLTVAASQSGYTINGLTQPSATILIPEGWSVDVTFDNRSNHAARVEFASAHSATVIAHTPMTNPSNLSSFRFTTASPGNYRFQVIGVTPIPTLSVSIEPAGDLPSFQTHS